MTATPTKTSLENQVRVICTTSRLFQFIELLKRGRQVGTAFKLRGRMKNIPSCTHVLYETSNLIISRRCSAEYGEEMYQVNIYNTRAGSFFFSLNPIVFGRYRSRRSSFLNSLTFESTGSILRRTRRRCSRRGGKKAIAPLGNVEIPHSETLFSTFLRDWRSSILSLDYSSDHFLK